MNRLMILAAAITMAGVGEFTHEFVANPQVDLQPASPGTVQTGHINVSGTVMAGTFYGSSGGTTTKVVSGWATSPTGFVFGGDFRTNSVDGRGIFASALATSGSTYGGDFRSASPSGRGIFGYATSTTCQAIGGDFRTDASSGIGLVARSQGTAGAYAAQFTSAGTTDYIATVDVGNNATSGTVYGVRSTISTSNYTGAAAFIGEGRSGYGIRAKASTGTGYGGNFYGNSRGVDALAETGEGTHSVTNNKDSNGVYGTNPSGGTGSAIYANGRLTASGTKSMQIDDPRDPQNRYLIQYCAEGDTPQLQYRGTTKLDSNGAASIQLPSYFHEINRDPSYQLTAMGSSMPGLYVAQEEVNNVFKIAGGKPGGKVSWMVIGIRNDPYVKRYGARNEVEKPDAFKGTFLRPELYGQPRQMREGYSEKEEIDRTEAANRKQDPKR